VRLLTVTHFYETHGGGIERVAGHLNRHLAALGHETRWAASDGDPPPAAETAASVPLRCVNIVEKMTGLPMPIPSRAALRRLRQAVRESDAVIVHDSLYATSVAAMRAARRAGKPVLLVQHIAGIPFRNALLRGAMRLANRLVTERMLGTADQVVFISQTTAAHFARIPLKRPALVAFNGVDTEIFRPARVGEKGEARRALGLDAGRPLALFVGRFVEKKGLAVIRELAARRPQVMFALAGSGPIDPASWGLANVRVAADLAGVSLASLYRAADIFVLPSVGEGYPLVVQEALATGLPVLCGAESAAADPAVTALLHGLAVDLAAPGATADAFARVLDEALIAPADPRRAALARDRYSWASAAGLYEAALKSLVGRTQADRGAARAPNPTSRSS
jgi:glycosyltransferase involved in cell wall biosynthesis